MSIDYDFVLDSSQSPAQLAEWLTTACGLTPVSGTRHPRLVAPALIAHIADAHQIRRELIEETFGIRTTLIASFSVDKFDLATAMRGVVSVCQSMLAESRGDLVLLFNGEKGLVLRKSGRVLFDGSDPVWHERWEPVSRALGIPFLNQSLPSI